MSNFVASARSVVAKSGCQVQPRAKTNMTTAPLAARSNFAGVQFRSQVAVFGNKKTSPVSGRVALDTTCSLALLREAVEQEHMKKDLMKFRVGQDVKVGVTITEGNKTRVQNYEGIIIAIHKNGLSSSITVRKMVQGIGVERVFPIHSPLCTFEEVKKRGEAKVRRAKLYYLRGLQGKAARLKRKV